MNKIEEMKKELEELELTQTSLKQEIELQTKINDAKNKISYMKINNTKAVQTTKKITNPIWFAVSSIGIGFYKSGQWIWNHGLKGILEQGGEAGRTMMKDMDKNPKIPVKKSKDKKDYYNNPFAF